MSETTKHVCCLDLLRNLNVEFLVNPKLKKSKSEKIIYFCDEAQLYLMTV
jgi:hypothetical protein